MTEVSSRSVKQYHCIRWSDVPSFGLDTRTSTKYLIWYWYAHTNENISSGIDTRTPTIYFIRSSQKYLRGAYVPRYGHQQLYYAL